MIPHTLNDEFAQEARALVDFARTAATADGFGWLDDNGHCIPEMGTKLWITGRMVHSFSLGHLLGYPDCHPLIEHGINCLLHGPLRDTQHGGWHSTVSADHLPVVENKVSYDHSFVILAASSALAAGYAPAQELLDAALADFERLWWDEEYGMVVDARGADGQVDAYRGVNANMHSVEALLAAYAATNDPLHLKRALRITEHVCSFILDNNYRLPEHFDPSWAALHEYNRDIPADAFRPFGSTIGHWLEWSRLILELRAECQHANMPYREAFDTLPSILYRRSLAEGWGCNGQPGFLYTVDFAGTPVVSQRMHWVLCEAIGAAASLAHANNDPTYWADVEMYWQYAQDYVILRPGEWTQELSPDNHPAPTTWAGKPDIYHALQAMLVGQLPLRPSFCWSLNERSSSC